MDFLILVVACKICTKCRCPLEYIALLTMVFNSRTHKYDTTRWIAKRTLVDKCKQRLIASKRKVDVGLVQFSLLLLHYWSWLGLLFRFGVERRVRLWMISSRHGLGRLQESSFLFALSKVNIFEPSLMGVESWNTFKLYWVLSLVVGSIKCWKWK